MSGVGFAEMRPTPSAQSSAPEPTPPLDSKMIEVPGTSLEQVDGLTNVPVTITLGRFLISATQVTQKEYADVTEENPSFHRGADLPTETVSSVGSYPILQPAQLQRKSGALLQPGDWVLRHAQEWVSPAHRCGMDPCIRRHGDAAGGEPTWPTWKLRDNRRGSTG